MYCSTIIDIWRETVETIQFPKPATYLAIVSKMARARWPCLATLLASGLASRRCTGQVGSSWAAKRVVGWFTTMLLNNNCWYMGWYEIHYWTWSKWIFESHLIGFRTTCFFLWPSRFPCILPLSKSMHQTSTSTPFHGRKKSTNLQQPWPKVVWCHGGMVPVSSLSILKRSFVWQHP